MNIRAFIENLNEDLNIRQLIGKIARKTGRRNLLPAASALVLLVLALSLWAAVGAESRRLASDKKLEVRFERVIGQYNTLKAARDEFARRAALSPAQGILKAVGDLVAGTGLKGKMATIKPLDTTRINGFTSERAQVTFSVVNLNEMVNLLYRIENAPMLLSIRRAEFRSSFAAPALDINLVLALTRRKK
ncbi:MAG: hypothetical protein M0Z58_05925 [Nitrospiraceae bacterium]|nr:hypothetical protein [Nitrospiraceae bacterium]